VFPIAARAGCAIEKTGAVADVGSSKRIDDAGHNLCPLGEAAIASAMQRKEKLRMLYRSHNIFDQAFVMMTVIFR
jgi:hypothetical protein